MTKKRWILFGATATALTVGIVLLRPSRANDAALLTPGTKFRLIKMDDLVGRPIFEFSSGNQKLRFPPARNPGIVVHQPVDRPGAAAVIGGAGPAFADTRWIVDGQALRIDYVFEDIEWIHVPYLFGKESREVTLIPKPGASPLRVRLPANGRPAPKLPKIDQTVGRFRLTMKPMPILSPMAEPVYEVRVESSKAGEDVCVNIRLESDTQGGPPSGTYLKASPEPGIFRMNRWFSTEGLFTIQIIPLTTETGFAEVKRKGNVVEIYFEKGKLLSTRTIGPDSWEGSSGESEFYDVRYNGIPLGLSKIDAEINTGLPSLDVEYDLPNRAFFEKLRDGERLPVTAYKMEKDVKIEVRVTLPRPSIFDL